MTENAKTFTGATTRRPQVRITKVSHRIKVSPSNGIPRNTDLPNP